MDNNLLDLKDRKILSILDMDARMPVSQIGKRTRLSRKVVEYRIKRMEKKGIILGYTTVIDIMKLGFIFVRVFVKFQNIAINQQKNLIEYLLASKAGVVVRDGGEYDLGISVTVRSIMEFDRFMTAFNRKFGKYFANVYISIANSIHFIMSKYLDNTKQNDYLNE